MRFFTMQHRGGFIESLETRKEIDEKLFLNLLPLYDYYCFDDRINCHRFILKDMEHKFKDYTTWLLKEME